MPHLMVSTLIIITPSEASDETGTFKPDTFAHIIKYQQAIEVDMLDRPKIKAGDVRELYLSAK